MTKNVNITITTDASQTNAALAQTKAGVKDVESTVSSSSQNIGKGFDSINTRSVALGSAIGTVLGGLVTRAFSAINTQLDGAIRRFDVINNFPKIMTNFGIATDDSAAAMTRLVAGVSGLPTSLDDITSLAEAFTPMTHNIGDATTLALAFNDALLAGGTPMQVQTAAMEQFRQALAKGMPQLQDWRSLESAMPAQLQQIGSLLGLGAGKLAAYANNGQGLYNAMQDGKLSLTDFSNALVQLDTKANGIFPSFQQQAANATGGIGTQITVLKQTIQQGMVDIFNAIGQANISAFFSGLSDVIKVVTYNAIIFVQIMIGVFNTVGQIANAIGGFFNGLFGQSNKAAATQTATAATSKNMASTAGAAAGVASGLGDANDQAKKLSTQLAGFDEMNTLKTPTSASGTTSGSGVNGIDLNTAGLDTSAIDGATSALDKLKAQIDKMSPAAKIIGGLVTALLGFTLLGGIAKGVGLVANLVKYVGGLAGVTGIINGFRLAWAGLTIGLSGGVIAEGGIIVRIFASIGGALASAGGAIAAFVEGAGGLSGILVGLGRIIAQVASKFGLIGLAIAAVITILILVFTHLTEIGNFFRDLPQNIGNIVGAIGNFFGTVGAFIGGVLAAIGGFFAGIATTVATFFVNIATAIANFFAPIINGIMTVVGVIGQILYSIFILFVAIFATIIQWVFETFIVPLGNFFVDLWNGIVATAQTVWTGIVSVFTTIITWLKDNIIDPIANFFVGLWNGIVAAAQVVWTGIVAFFTPIVTWINTTIIQPIANFFVGLWNGIVTGVTNFINTFKAVLGAIGSWVKTYVIDPIANFFTGLWNGIVSGIQGLIGGIQTVFNTIVNLIKTPINGVIDAINGVLKSLNNVKVPDWVPGIGGQHPNFPMIPKLAMGGVISSPTVAMFGEAGAEAVVPLENNTGWIDKIAGQLATTINGGNSGGQPIALTVKIGEDTIATKIIEVINDRTSMSGRNQILV